MLDKYDVIGVIICIVGVLVMLLFSRVWIFVVRREK